MCLHLSRQKKMPEFFKEEMRKLRPKCLRFIADNLPKIDLKQIVDKKMHHSVATDVILVFFFLFFFTFSFYKLQKKKTI